MFDYHIHSSYSADSKASPRSIIESALDGGLTEICFTDHIDHGFISLYTGTAFMFDLDPYFAELQQLQEEYRNRITLKIGLELGVQPTVIKHCQKLLNNYTFDYVLASVHNVSQLDLTGQALADQYSPLELWTHYFQEMYYSLQNLNNFQAVGHFDVPKRYNKNYAQCDLTSLYPLIREIFTHLVQAGKGIEINSGGLLHGLPYANPSPDLLRIYRECGGEIITFGSDSHRASTLGHQFKEMVELLSSLDFKYLCTFDQGQPHFHSLQQLK